MLLNFPAAPPGLPGWYQEKQGQWSEPVVCIHLVTGAACKHSIVAGPGAAAMNTGSYWDLGYQHAQLWCWFPATGAGQ